MSQTNDKKILRAKRDAYETVLLQLAVLTKGDWSIKDLKAWLKLKIDRCKNAEASIKKACKSAKIMSPRISSTICGMDCCGPGCYRCQQQRL